MPILVQLNLEVITSITSIARRTTSHWQKICGCLNLIDFIALCDPSPNIVSTLMLQLKVGILDSNSCCTDAEPQNKTLRKLNLYIPKL